MSPLWNCPTRWHCASGGWKGGEGGSSEGFLFLKVMCACVCVCVCDCGSCTSDGGGGGGVHQVDWIRMGGRVGSGALSEAVGLPPLPLVLSLHPLPLYVAVPIGLPSPSALDRPVLPILTLCPRHPLPVPSSVAPTEPPNRPPFHCSASGPRGGGQRPSPLATCVQAETPMLAMREPSPTAAVDCLKGAAGGGGGGGRHGGVGPQALTWGNVSPGGRGRSGCTRALHWRPFDAGRGTRASVPLRGRGGRSLLRGGGWGGGVPEPKSPKVCVPQTAKSRFLFVNFHFFQL